MVLYGGTKSRPRPPTAGLCWLPKKSIDTYAHALEASLTVPTPNLPSRSTSTRQSLLAPTVGYTRGFIIYYVEHIYNIEYTWYIIHFPIRIHETKILTHKHHHSIDRESPPPTYLKVPLFCRKLRKRVRGNSCSKSAPVFQRIRRSEISDSSH